MSAITVTEINIYPIKSCRGITLQKAEVTPKGFVNDREFMIVDEYGKFITQRQQSKLAQIIVKITENEITLTVANDSFSFIPTLTGEKIEVEVWRDRIFAIDQGNNVANWLQSILQKNVRLVKQSPHHPRLVNPNYAIKDTDEVSFADGYPYLLTNTASLAELNQKLPQPIPMNRFRPNIVINPSESFIEDSWKTIKIGDITFNLVKPCSRCIIITTDQFTGERDKFKEPLRTLSTFRHFSQGEIMFGMNMIATESGVIKVGDKVEIL